MEPQGNTKLNYNYKNTKIYKEKKLVKQNIKVETKNTKICKTII